MTTPSIIHQTWLMKRRQTTTRQPSPTPTNLYECDGVRPIIIWMARSLVTAYWFLVIKGLQVPRWIEGVIEQQLTENSYFVRLAYWNAWVVYQHLDPYLGTGYCICQYLRYCRLDFMYGY